MHPLFLVSFYLVLTGSLGKISVCIFHHSCFNALGFRASLDLRPVTTFFLLLFPGRAPETELSDCLWTEFSCGLSECLSAILIRLFAEECSLSFPGADSPLIVEAPFIRDPEGTLTPFFLGVAVPKCSVICAALGFILKDVLVGFDFEFFSSLYPRGDSFAFCWYLYLFCGLLDPLLCAGTDPDLGFSLSSAFGDGLLAAFRRGRINCSFWTNS